MCASSPGASANTRMLTSSLSGQHEPCRLEEFQTSAQRKACPLTRLAVLFPGLFLADLYPLEELVHPLDTLIWSR